MESLLQGIIPPVVTPLINDKEIDEAGLERLIHHLEGGGVHGLFLLGTTGEAVSLSHSLRRRYVKMVCDLVDHRIPVLVGVSDTSFEDTIGMTDFCKEAGADMVVLAPPYYFPISQEEMMYYLDDLVPRLNLPVMLYNMPSHTKLSMSVETIKHARELGVTGIKDSSGDIHFLYSLIETFKDFADFSVISGTELFIPETIQHGGHGAIAGGANMFPGLFVELYNASINRNYNKIMSLRQIVIEIERSIYNVGKFASRSIVGTKCALSVLGLCSDYLAHPLRKFEGDDRYAIEKYVKDISEKIDRIL